ncbi:MAG: pyrroloquinoline quinone biosynthesis protein PqqE [Myxococcales bacterium]|nr:pyrroloquinoline quinone biosynthesis protein PqqE [Myxococcales bacterium]MDH3842406.1 pyrroloquinoline quinone biosynthesis protein PqqE [Myxococcales bacterium]
MVGSSSKEPNRPLWVLAELTYRCPLQCFYCSNPIGFAQTRRELSTTDWLRVLREARELGAVQLGFSGGEPLLRSDLEVLIEEAARLEYYTNLITSGIGMNEQRLSVLKSAGLDHIQLSFQASTAELNNYIGGAASFEHKRDVARLIKKQGYPMVLNVVLHRGNIDTVDHILDFAEELEADYVELANAQYGGWARLNRNLLLPSRSQLDRAEAKVATFRRRLQSQMRIFYVVSDYFEGRPKPCTAGWGRTFMQITPDGTALPCHGARELPGMRFPRVNETSIAEIWKSPEFNRFRGEGWMKEPCQTCPERHQDFGGCRCQAYLLTGDPENTDPACALSPDHDLIQNAIETARRTASAMQPPKFRNVHNSRIHGDKLGLRQV